MSRLDTVIERDVAPSTRTVDMKLEVVSIPVADVDRAKRFYGDLGWRLDGDFVVGDAFRGVQFTPPGSPCSGGRQPCPARHGGFIWSYRTSSQPALSSSNAVLT
jgi:predicted enzyme related to lactoylglutathione lyase